MQKRNLFVVAINFTTDFSFKPTGLQAYTFIIILYKSILLFISGSRVNETVLIAHKNFGIKIKTRFSCEVVLLSENITHDQKLVH